MKPSQDTDAFRGATTEHPDGSMDQALRFASKVKSRWRGGVPPDAKAVLAEHPDLLRYRSLVLDLAAEEYTCRQANGEPITADEFVRSFPGMERSLYLLLEVQRLLGQDSLPGISPNEIVWPEPGDEFLGYSLLGELGKGTFGHVFLATEPALGNRLVALKVAPQGQWEAELLGKLSHPNIVPVHSIQRDPETDLTAVCMPYLGRVTLLDVIERAFANHSRPHRGRVFSDLLTELNEPAGAPLPEDFDIGLDRSTYSDAVVHLAIQITDALAFTHKQGIYHRDLKPSNILLTNNGRPLILDFNLSTDEKISPARIGGTLPYMAPEQIHCLLTGGSAAQTPNTALSDIYSLGVILYELLTGALPCGFPRMKGSWEDVALDHLARQKNGPVALRNLNADVDKGLASLVEACLAFEPQLRPQSAASLAASLRHQVTFYRRTVRWRRRHPWTVLGSAVTLALCGLSCALWLALRDPYPVRLHHEGLAYLERGKSPEAIERFDAALRISPDNQEILIERGKALYLQGQFLHAFDDFQRADALHPTGDVAALQGHCLCKKGLWREAIAKFQIAEAAGHQSLSLLNNLGFCYLQAKDYAAADRSFRQAIALDPNCATAWLNLERLLVRRLDRKEEIPVQVVTSTIDGALSIEKPTPDIFLYAATLESRLAKNDPGLVLRIREHLNKALSLGLDPRRIANDPLLKRLWEQDGSSSLAGVSPKAQSSQSGDGTIPPF